MLGQRKSWRHPLRLSRGRRHEPMRRDTMRRKLRGQLHLIGLGEVAIAVDNFSCDVKDLNDAQTQRGREEAQKAELVKLRFVAGLSLEETAEALGISPATAKRYWAFARAWLYG